MFVLNGNGKKVLEAFKRIGFGDYEARAYFTLLLCGEMTAWNVARKSGVPQSKVYHTLQSLADKEIVSVRYGMPKTYESMPLKKLVSSYIMTRQSDIEYAIKTERWITEVADAIATTVRNHKRRIRVFEPRYTRG